MSNEQNPNLRCIQAIYIPVSDAYASGRWYAERFGLTVSWRNPFEPGCGVVLFEHFEPGKQLFLIETETGDVSPLQFRARTWRQNGSPVIPVFCFEVRDLDGLYQRMRDAGDRVDSVVDGGECGKAFACYDPDGHLLQVFGGWPGTEPVEEQQGTVAGS